MKVLKSVLCAATGLGALAIIGTVTAPRIVAAIKAAYVEVVIPGRPFSDFVTVTNNSGNGVPLGPGSGVLGISSITLNNYNSTTQIVTVFPAILTGNSPGACNGTIIGGSSPQLGFIIAPNSTLHVPYPTPVAMSVSGGATCIAAQSNSNQTKSVEVYVTGFVN